jgi:hypothetical protein
VAAGLQVGLAATPPQALAPDAVSDMTAITTFLSAESALVSRWTGRLVVDPSIQGAATDYDGTVRVDPHYAGVASRFARDWVLSHEAVHTISRGLTPEAFARLPGWEEGPAEGMRRLLQQRIFTAALGYSQPDTTYAMQATARAPYDAYVVMLERARNALGMDGFAFYRALLATPLAARPTTVDRWARRARMRTTPAEQRFLRSLTRGDGAMTRLG